jgi:site-specific recombinase XerD
LDAHFSILDPKESTTATMLTTKDVSLATVGKILGHKSLVTTQKYAHVEDKALVAAAKILGV